MVKSEKLFSDRLEVWLKSSEPKTLKSLQEVFGEKSLAIFVLLLMFLPATPLPTGGITHIFEIITMFIGAEMALGIKKFWLPKFLLKKQLSDRMMKKAMPFIVRRIKWFEHFSRPRMVSTLQNPLFIRLIGLMILFCAAGSFSAPWFSGLDTLPALGAVIIALAIILEDMVLLIAGFLIGVAGVGLILTLGATLFTVMKHLLHI